MRINTKDLIIWLLSFRPKGEILHSGADRGVGSNRFLADARIDYLILRFAAGRHKPRSFLILAKFRNQPLATTSRVTVRTSTIVAV